MNELDHLRHTIREAFADVPRPPQSMRQYWLVDTRGMSGTITEDEWREAGDSRPDSAWTDLDAAEIESCGCQIAHMDRAAFEYYLPAYLWHCAGKATQPLCSNDVLMFTLFSLIPKPEHIDDFEAMTSGLSARQKQAIIDFLEFISTQTEEFSDEVREALAYWERGERRKR